MIFNISLSAIEFDISAPATMVSTKVNDAIDTNQFSYDI